MFSCIKCVRDFSKIDLYLLHIKHVHSHEPGFCYVCGFQGCPITSFSYSALRSHLLRHKELAPNKNNVKMICHDCGFGSYLKSKFVSHFKEHNIIICPIQNCNQTYNVYSSFSSHLSRTHAYFKAKDITNISSVNSQDQNTTSVNKYLIDECLPSFQRFDEMSGRIHEFKRNISLFVIKMQEKFLLPQSVISELVLGMNQVQEENIALFKHNVLNLIQKFDGSFAISDAVLNEQSYKAFNSTLSMLNSAHQKTTYMKSLGLVEPVQYNLGFVNKKQATFQYVPLIDNLKAFIKIMMC